MADESFELKFQVDATDITTLGDGFLRTEKLAHKLETSIDQLAGSLDSVFGDASKATQGLEKLGKMAQKGVDKRTADDYKALSESLERINKLTNQAKFTPKKFGEARATAEGDLAKEIANFKELSKVISMTDAQREKYNNRLTTEQLAQREAQKLQEKQLNQLPRLRYALYDLSNATTRLGQSLLNGVTKPLSTAIDMQRDFADVIRTVGGDTNKLRNQFEDLFTSLPMSWAELTDIGTLAGQLNIASQDVANFTELVAKFAATTDVSIEQSATAFGRLSELLNVAGEDYERLGSSILRVGVNSVATESQIIAISTQIAAMGNLVGLTADEVFGLSAAMASLGIQPELARGTITRLFTNILNAVSQSGEKLQDFARISRMTATQFAELWKSDASAALVALLRGIQAEGDGATRALQGLGIASVRDIPAILRLSQNLGLVEESLQEAKTGWEEGTELQNQYGVIAETVASKLQVLQNSFDNLLATIGEAGAGIGWLIDLITGLVKGINLLLSNPIGQFFATATLAVIGIAGAFSLLVGVVSRVLGNMALIPTVLQATNLEMLKTTGSTNALTGAMGRLGLSTNIATGALKAFKVALISTGIGALIVGIGTALGIISETADKSAEAFKHLGKTYADDFANKISTTQSSEIQSLISDIDLLREALSEDDLGDLLQGQGRLVVIGAVRGVLQGIDEDLAQLATTSIPEAKDAFDRLQATLGLSDEEMAKAFPLLSAAIKGVAVEIDYAEQQLESLKNLLNDETSDIRNFIELSDAISNVGDALRETGGDSAEAFNSIYSVVELISELSPRDNVKANLQAFFDMLVNQAGVSAESLIWLQNIINGIAGSNGTATMNFASLWSTFSKGATKATRSATRQVRTLLDYANDVAQVWDRAFGIRFDRRSALDDIITGWREINDRIDEYRRKLASLTADRSIKEYWLQVAEAFGDSLRADTLRAEIADLNKQIEEAQAGASTSLKGNSKGAIQNRKTVMDMVGSYQDYIKALIESGASQKTIQAAIKQSKNDFYAQGQALGFSRAELDLYAKAFDDMSKAVKNTPKNVTVKANTDPAQQALNELMAKINKSSGTVKVNTKIDFNKLREELNKFFKQNPVKPVDENGKPVTGGGGGGLFFRMFKSGGYTGSGGVNQIAGAVHGKEYVIPAHGVNQRTKLPDLSYVASLQRGRSAPQLGYQSGGYVSGGNVPVELGASTMRNLQSWLSGQIGVLVESTRIADLSNRGNAQLARQGAVR